MSVDFYGWEVVYDDAHQLQANQTPKTGTVYTMYHGTKIQTARQIIQNGFVQSTDGMLGPGVYVSRDQKKATRYPISVPRNDKLVLKLRVDVGRVKKIDRDNHEMQKTWHANGYDTAWVPPNCGMQAVPSGLEEDCVWDPNRIEVIDILHAPDNTILTELKGLLQTARSNASSRQRFGRSNCNVCNTEMESPHQLESCWGCGEQICSFMSKHYCY